MLAGIDKQIRVAKELQTITKKLRERRINDDMSKQGFMQQQTEFFKPVLDSQREIKQGLDSLALGVNAFPESIRALPALLHQQPLAIDQPQLRAIGLP